MVLLGDLYVLLEVLVLVLVCANSVNRMLALSSHVRGQASHPTFSSEEF